MTREEAIRIFQRWIDRDSELQYADREENTELYKIAIKALEEQPKTGHWKRVSIDKYVQHAMAFYRCSECDNDIIGEHNYCPNCGAKMQEVEE